MKNIEYKIFLGEEKINPTKLKRIGAVFCGELKQKDTYLNCQNGRLKLRDINEEKTELIFYNRPDSVKSRLSNYKIFNIDKKDSGIVNEILKKAIGEKAIVEKLRRLWIFGHTRIHLDQVKNLGNFVEIETVMKDIDLKKGRDEHLVVKNALSLDKFKPIKKSYSDLVLNKNLIIS